VTGSLMSHDEMDDAAALYSQARKAEIDQATWERRATLYTQRGKPDAAKAAAEHAAAAAERSRDLQARADAAETA
jgi:hypothetical protein